MFLYYKEFTWTWTKWGSTISAFPSTVIFKLWTTPDRMPETSFTFSIHICNLDQVISLYKCINLVFCSFHTTSQCNECCKNIAHWYIGLHKEFSWETASENLLRIIMCYTAFSITSQHRLITLIPWWDVHKDIFI